MVSRKVYCQIALHPSVIPLERANSNRNVNCFEGRRLANPNQFLALVSQETVARKQTEIRLHQSDEVLSLPVESVTDYVFLVRAY
jgi:hypothetical protein